MKKIIAIIMVVVSLFSVISVSAYAEEASEDTITVTVNETDFIFDVNTSEEYRNKFIAHYFNENDEDAATYGLMCTLFGHKTEQIKATKITHKVKTTSPRCKRDSYVITTCTRCDYYDEEYTGTSYISCCPVD